MNRVRERERDKHNIKSNVSCWLARFGFGQKWSSLLLLFLPSPSKVHLVSRENNTLAAYIYLYESREADNNNNNNNNDANGGASARQQRHTNDPLAFLWAKSIWIFSVWIIIIINSAVSWLCHLLMLLIVVVCSFRNVLLALLYFQNKS